jgi:hypothetical protein
MTYRLQNLMLAMLLALTTLFVGFGTLSQNPMSGGYQLFERTASGISADIQLVSLGNFAPPPETASEYANAPNTGVIPTTTAQTQNLRTNLRTEGVRFDLGEEAHHIVAKNDPRAAEARNLLAEAGVDVNSPANGVPLPRHRDNA